MKKSIICFLALSMLVLLQACEDFLEAEVKSEIPLDDFGNTLEEVSFFLTQAYIHLRDDDIHGNNYWRLLPDDFSIAPDATTFSQFDIAKMSFDSRDGSVLTFWSDNYLGISRTNLVIGKAVENMESLDQNDPDYDAWAELSGEARFIRAFHYFNLVRFFRNAPLIEDFFNSLDAINTVSNLPGDQMKDQENLLYDFIINDLELAAQQASDAPVRGRVSSWAAKTLLAKVLLTRATIEKHRDGDGDGSAYYQAVLTQLNDIIDNGGFSLTPYYPDLFYRDNQGNATNEIIFALEYHAEDNSENGLFVNSGLNGSGPEEFGTTAGANGGKQLTDWGISVFDLESPGDIVRRFWSFENAGFESLDLDDDGTIEDFTPFCPDGSDCEVAGVSQEPYPWARPYWFELIHDNNAFRNSPSGIDVVTDPVSGEPVFSIIWARNDDKLPGIRLMKYRRTPLRQSGYTDATYDADLPILRYAEVLLMYAEAGNELGGPNTVPSGGSMAPVVAVNMVRARARNFMLYPALTVDDPIVPTSTSYTATYRDVYSRVPEVAVADPHVPATDDALADQIFNDNFYAISAFKALREMPTSTELVNFADFPETADWVPDFATSDQAQFREDLLDERYRELAGEQGVRFFDLFRYGRYVDNILAAQTNINPLTGRSISDTHYGTELMPNPDQRFNYFPVPQREIDQNSNLNQNPGW